MIEKKITITVKCDKCGSEDLEARTEYYNEQFRTVLDCDNLSRRTALKSVDPYMVCRCKNCGHTFEEKLGTKHFDLLPDQVEI